MDNFKVQINFKIVEFDNKKIGLQMTMTKITHLDTIRRVLKKTIRL